MSGQDLLKELIRATGLPEEAVSRELSKLLTVPPEQLTLEDLRELLAAYAQDVLVRAKEEQL